MTFASRYSIPTTVMLQQVDDETLLFDSSTQLFFSLNEAGTVFWEVMREHTELAKVFEELIEMYDVDKNQLEDDLRAFSGALADQKLIIVS